mmetsp:Transcript_38554/g.121362  ORF Transcript_38554/g.121362 Transcript_38554/m.121362 type:complete len:90 (-) Transcript_38554:1-270(-)
MVLAGVAVGSVLPLFRHDSKQLTGDFVSKTAFDLAAAVMDGDEACLAAARAGGEEAERAGPAAARFRLCAMLLPAVDLQLRALGPSRAP